ncbi:hypothetical protein FCV43_10620 [Vibrio genomosp. F6]|uniref:hypothetical protein n=1 Tax=Vibrio genomosp. F6 TaxID=723172 RepID=UPI000DE957E6|nr:hypothetical protein [Vibrio genomosp. F6]RBW64541.1 hypothetical protein DS893_12670 [Vibrionales bacterium C3R12]TKF21767.1 hypothetical protein FCV43_10620 [Vibrio genomosp. F6]
MLTQHFIKKSLTSQALFAQLARMVMVLAIILVAVHQCQPLMDVLVDQAVNAGCHQGVIESEHHNHDHSRLIQSNKLSRTSQSTQNGEPNSNLPHNGLVTTFSSIVFKSNTAHIFHVGDSRIYRFRGGDSRY